MLFDEIEEEEVAAWLTNIHRLAPGVRRATSQADAFGVVEKPLELVGAHLQQRGRAQEALLLVLLARRLGGLCRGASTTRCCFRRSARRCGVLRQAIASGELLAARAGTSIKVLLIGYALGLALAAVLTTLAITSRIGTDLLETLTSMFNPLPAIALLPLALIWFGLGNGSIVFVLIHSVLWPVALNTHSGFLSVSHDAAHGRAQLRPVRIRATWRRS